MSQRDGFASGFLAGAIVGGIFGGIVGALVTSRTKDEAASENNSLLDTTEANRELTQDKIETARRSLEGKIAQLNLAIDDVRQQLGTVHSNNREQE